MVLAYTEETTSIHVDPFIILVDDLLEDIFPGTKERIRKARKAGSRFLRIARHADQSLLQQIEKRKVVGIYTSPDYRRIYTRNEECSNLTGFCDHELSGKAGVELRLDTTLREKSVSLSIDLPIQTLLYKKVKESVQEFDGEGGSGVVLNIYTGNILAMASYPNPLTPLEFLESNKRNRNLDPTEVGSVLKVLTAAMALESGSFTPETMVDPRGPFMIGGYEVTDVSAVNREITLRESLWKSSNIATARIALELGTAYQREMLKRVGCLDSIEWLPGYKVHPIRPNSSRTTTATLGYGYGIGLTTLHLAQAIIASVSGYKVKPNIIQAKRVVNRERVFSRNTVNQMRSIMEDVANNMPKLKIKGMKIGAKTGTANMIVNREYVEGMNFISLATILPADKPKFLVIMQMSNPKKERLKSGKYTTAGNVLSKYMKDFLIEMVNSHKKRLSV